MKKRTLKYIYVAIVLLFALLFVGAFGGPAILKAYVQAGVGNCRTIPILCIVPEEEVLNPKIDKTYLSEFLPYSFPAKELPYFLPRMEVSVPKGFIVIRGSLTKVYYKRRKYNAKSPTIYLLYQKPKFFINIFPQVKGQGIENNYDFVNRTLNAQFTNIGNITDTFFVIMKSVFTPDIGDQKNVKIVKFKTADNKGFITYNFTASENYFDCDVIKDDDAFLKVYIKDKDRKLDLDKVIAIISTLKVPKIPVLDTSK